MTAPHLQALRQALERISPLEPVAWAELAAHQPDLRYGYWLGAKIAAPQGDR